MSLKSLPHLYHLDIDALRALAQQLMGELEQRDRALEETRQVVGRDG